MLKQDYYDLLIKAANDGTFPSLTENGDCKYRFGEKKCAVGILIDDEKYDPSIENLKANSSRLNLSDYISDWPGDLNVEDLRNVQICHDIYAFDVYKRWNKEAFIKSLNSLPFFDDVKKVKV